MNHCESDVGGARESRRWALLTAVAISAAMTGCAQLARDPGHQREAAEQVSRVDRHSAFPVVRRIYLEQVNLVEMIDPDSRSEKLLKAWPADAAAPTDPADPAAAEKDWRVWGRRYDLVLAWFRSTSEITAEDKAIRRDGVQDKIMAATESRCNVFKTFLRRQQSDVNFQLGTATTVAGVLGAVLPGANDSRNLAAVAGMLSGAQAEFNSAYYSNLAAQVIAQGVDVRMARLKKEVLQNRAGKSIANYSMEAAIRDAITIDGACSTVAGLTEAAESIKEAVNPGLARAAEVIAAVKVAGEMARAPNIKDMANSGELASLLKQTNLTVSPLAVTYSGEALRDTDNSLQAALISASRARSNALADAAIVARELSTSYASAQNALPASDKSSLSPDQVQKQFESETAGFGKSVAALPFAACQARILDALSNLMKASAAAKLEEPNTEKRLSVEAQLGQARASAKSVLQDIDLLSTTARSLSALTANAWRAKFSSAKLTEAALTSAVVPPPDMLATMCK